MSVKMTCADELVQKLKEIQQMPPSFTRTMIKEMFKKNSEDIISKELKVALCCPLGKMKIQVSLHSKKIFDISSISFSVSCFLLLQVPCRPHNCLHIQCFDALFFLKANMLKHENMWKCPICKGKATFDDLRVDSFFHQVLQSKNLPEDAQEIVLDSNASWKVYEDNEAKIDVIDLTEEEDEDTNLNVSHLPKKENQPKRMMQPYIKLERLSNIELLRPMSKAPQSEKENNASSDLDEIPNLSDDQDELEEDVPIQEVIVLFSL